MDEGKRIRYAVLGILLFAGAIKFEAIAGGKIFVDQLGFTPFAPKSFTTSQSADSFFVVKSSSGIISFRGKIVQSRISDPASGLTLYEGDFSSLHEQGIFRIFSSAQDTSFPFQIADSVYNPLFRAALKGFYFQRCGVALSSSYAGQYARAQCHTADGFLHTSTGSSVYREATGGWHDAGDYGKYIVNAGVSVGTLLMAYEFFPDQFSTDDLGIPESGNNIPDILDEARYELSWLLKMQSSGGGVYFKLTREQFEGFVMPAQDNTATRYLYSISTTATGDFAAVMAKAARIFDRYDRTFADTCLAAAERAWDYLSANSTIVPAGGFKNPTGTATGEYGDSQDSDERLWAAAELFRTTGIQKYNLFYLFNYSRNGLFTSSMSWQNVTSMAHLTYLASQQIGTDSVIQGELRTSLKSFCDAQITNRNLDGFHCVIPPGQYYWGSNSQPLNNAILLLVASSQGMDSIYRSAALDQLHYITGHNANGICYVTGLGTRSTMNPHHRPSASDGIVAPVPGLLAGGPDQYLDDAILKGLYTSSTPPALCYADQRDSYASNETAINWNAPLVFVAGFFASPNVVMHTELPSTPVASGFQLGQSYPNPFNPSTSIRFSLPHAGAVQLLVYDILGRRIRTLIDGYTAAGQHVVRWDGKDNRGITVSSSVYFYQLLAGGVVIDTKKTILAK